VTCRVLGFQNKAPFSGAPTRSDNATGTDARLINAAIGIHHDDPEFGYRFIADDLPRPLMHDAAAYTDR
jgi:hypothetical protein